MAQRFDDSVDSPVEYDQQVSFAGGQNSKALPRNLKDSEVALLQDCTRDQSARLISRSGTTRPYFLNITRPVLQMFRYQTNSADDLYVISDIRPAGNIMHLYKVTSSGWTDQGAIETLFNAGGPFKGRKGFSGSAAGSMVQGAGKLYMCQANIYGLPQAFVYSWDGTTLTNLSTGAANAAPGQVSILVWHTNRLVAAGSQLLPPGGGAIVPDGIYFSNILDATTWGVTGNDAQIRVGAGDGQTIVAVTPFNRFNLAVFKENSSYVVTADPQLAVSDFPITLVSSNIGCASAKSAVQVGEDVLFLALDGVHSLNNVIASDQQSTVDPPLSYPVQDIIERITPGSIGDAAAVFWNGLYILSIAIDGSNTNNYVLVYNRLLNSWDGVWTNLPISVFCTQQVSNGKDKLLMGLSTVNGEILEYLDYVPRVNWTNATFTDYDGLAVLPRVTTRSLTWGDVRNPKVALGGELEWGAGATDSFVVTPITDGTTQAAQTLPAAGSSRGQFDLLRHGEFRELQLDIQTTGSGRKEIVQVSVAGMPRASTIGNS